MKKISIVLSVLLLLGIAACSKTPTIISSQPEEEEKQKWEMLSEGQTSLTVATALLVGTILVKCCKDTQFISNWMGIIAWTLLAGQAVNGIIKEW